MGRLSPSQCWRSVAFIGALAGCSRSDLVVGEESIPDAGGEEIAPVADPVDGGADAPAEDTGAAVGVDAAPPPLVGTYAAHTLAAIFGATADATNVSLFTFDEEAGFAEEGTLRVVGNCQTLAFDAQRNLYVGCSANPASGQPGEVLVFASGSSNAAEPLRVIASPLLASSAIGGIAIDPAGNVYVAAPAIAGDDAGDSDSAVVVFGPSSDAAPTRVIQELGTPLESLEGIALDSSDDIWVLCPDALPLREFAAGTDGRVAALQTFASPDLAAPDFSALAIGGGSSLWVLSSNIVAWYATTPAATTFGGMESVLCPSAIAADDLGNVFVLTANWTGCATTAPQIQAFRGSGLTAALGSPPAPESTVPLPALSASGGAIAVSR